MDRLVLGFAIIAIGIPISAWVARRVDHVLRLVAVKVLTAAIVVCVLVAALCSPRLCRWLKVR